MKFSINTIFMLSAFVATTTYASPIDVMVYETDESNNSPAQALAQQINGRVNDITVTVFGQGGKYAGFGSKFSALLPLLQKKDPNALIVVSDSRDVLINNPASGTQYVTRLAEEFQMFYKQLTFGQPEAIVVSAEAQCCVSALTHAKPGDYFNVDGSRNKQSCLSGEAGCMWNGDAAAQPWEDFMKQAMVDQLQGLESSYSDMYLNAGLIAGTAKNLIRVIQAAQIGDSEDDQAVLTDYMYRHPKEIVLDYQQLLFGSNRGAAEGLTEEEKCPFHVVDGETRLHHITEYSSPLFIHSPGGYYECHDRLAQLLGVPTTAASTKLRTRKLSGCNYGKCSTFPERTPTDLEKYLLGGRV